eukprot:6050696-Amphidinium_carterae.1
MSCNLAGVGFRFWCPYTGMGRGVFFIKSPRNTLVSALVTILHGIKAQTAWRRFKLVSTGKGMKVWT